MGDEPPSPTAGPRVVAGDEQGDEAVDLDVLVELVRTTLAGEGVPADAEANLLLVDEASIAELNAEHLGGEGPTDVLSFPIDGPSLGLTGSATGANAAALGLAGAGSDAGAVGGTHPDGVLVGDVVICPAVARRSAQARGLELADELCLLAVHGALHLLGHDHADAEGAEAMRERELRYAGRSGATAAVPAEERS
jgi:probable rRNA maturation factor